MGNVSPWGFWGASVRGKMRKTSEALPTPELNVAGQPAIGWCFAAERPPAVGDMILA